MADILGLQVDLPTIDISGFISSSWIYVFIIALIGIVLIAGVAVLLFLTTYNRKIILFENVAGLGYQPVLKTRARIIRVGAGSVEVLKTMKGGEIISAYGRRMGRNSYWYGKGRDGYWYNFTLGDLDEILSSMGIKPVNIDVRMFHAARSKLTDSQYGEKRNWIEKYAPSMILLITVVILMVGMYVIAGKITEGLAGTTQAAEVNKETAELLNQMSSRLDSIQRGTTQTIGQGGSGLVPASEVDLGGG